MQPITLKVKDLMVSFLLPIGTETDSVSILSAAEKMDRMEIEAFLKNIGCSDIHIVP